MRLICKMDHLNRDSQSWYFDVVVRAQAGDVGAFEALACHYRAAVVAITFLRTGNRDDAEDLTQEVLVKVREKLGELKNPEAFPGWLKSIAFNACGSWYRRRRPVDSLDAQETPIRDYSAGPLEMLLEKERQRAWRRVLIELPGPNRYALLMHVWGGYSHQEIAEFLNVPVTTVEGRIHRAKTQLRRQLRSGADELLRYEEGG